MGKKQDKSNYSKNTVPSPFVQGRFREVVKPKGVRHTRLTHKTDKDNASELTVDLVQVLADNGICIKNVYTIAKGLVHLGWIKSKKLEG